MANTGYLPRKAAILRAVRPLKLSVIIARIFSLLVAFTACFARKAVTSLEFSSKGIRMSFSASLSFSACAAILAIVFTASTGYLPYAVSPLSINASVR